MAKVDLLIRLVNTLTKAEKRYFRLYSSLQQGSKDYVRLFDLLEKGWHQKTADVKVAFTHLYPGISYDVSSKYLYKIIMDCLLHLHLQHHPGAMLTAGLLKTEILFERSLYDEGHAQLQKLQDAAEAANKQELLLWALNREMELLNLLNFPDVPEKLLLTKQARINEVWQRLGNTQQQTARYLQLRHHLLYKGAARSMQQTAAFRQIPGLLQEPGSEVTTLLFKANYALLTGDYTAALDYFGTLLNRMESGGHLNADRPTEHLQVLEGILDSFRSTRRYKDMHTLLLNIKQLQTGVPYLEMMIHRLVFLYELISYIDSGNFPAALRLVELQAPALMKKMELLDISQQAEMYLYLALVYLGNEDINSAHDSLEKVLQQGKRYSSLPIFRTFKLIHLLLHYELGNYEYIRYETRAFRRHLQSDNKTSYLLEKTIIKFLRNKQVFPVSSRPSNMWKKMSSSFDKIKEDKYEMQLMKLFDFSAWIEAKVKKKPLGKILREKYEAEMEK